MKTIKYIRKYKNRKLYSANTSSYISMSTILEWIRRGDEVRIFTHDTNIDITEETLTKALVSEYRTSLKNAPAQEIYKLIQSA